MDRWSTLLRDVRHMWRSALMGLQVYQLVSTLVLVGVLVAWLHLWWALALVVLAVPAVLRLQLVFFRRAEARGQVADAEEWAAQTRAIYEGWPRWRLVLAWVVVAAVALAYFYMKLTWGTEDAPLGPVPGR